jgi:hypothetical protein
MAAEYLNHWRSGDEIHVRRFADRDAAVADLGVAVLEGDDDDYDCTVVVARDVFGRAVGCYLLDLLRDARSYADQARMAETAPYPPSMIGRAAA